MINPMLYKKLAQITPEEQKILDGEITIDKTIYMDNGDDIINSKKLLDDGKLITVRAHTRFAEFPEHTHDFIEIVYMCSGSTTHIINGSEVVLKEGELLFLCQGARQRILPASKGDVAVNFIILPEFFDGMLDMIGEENTPLRQFVIDCLKNNRDNTDFLHFSVSDVLPVHNLIENLIWTLDDEVSHKRSINRMTMGLVFMHLMNYAERLVFNYGENSVTVKALRYIEENYRKGSLRELASELYYDVSTLSRIIKNQTGRNYTDLVQERRLAQACYLLKNTNMNISEIAVSTGYDNISFFYRIFKKEYGVSPRQYRKG